MASANKCLENKDFSVSDFSILHSKTGKNFGKKFNYRWQQANQLMKKICPLFLWDWSFLTPEKKPKEKEKRTSKACVIVSRKTINFQTPISLSQRENTPFRNDKVKEKLLRNTRQFQQRKSDNKRRRNCASRTNCRFIQPTSKRTSHADHYLRHGLSW